MIIKRLSRFFKDFTQGFKESSIDQIERELEEMENAFALLLYGGMCGLVAPPAFVGIALLPYMERELKIMLAKSAYIDDMLASWADLVEL